MFSHKGKHHSSHSRLLLVSNTANCIFFKKICHKFQPRRHNYSEGIAPLFGSFGRRSHVLFRLPIAAHAARHSVQVPSATWHRRAPWTQGTRAIGNMASESPLDAGDPFVSPAQAITCGSPFFLRSFTRKGGGMSACVRGGRALVRRVGTRAEEFPNDRAPHIFRFPRWDMVGYSGI